MSNTPLLGLPEIAEGVTNQATLHNTALRKLEARAFRVLSMVTGTPAVGPAEGDSYIIPSGASGVWSSKTNQIASWIGGAWSYFTPFEGIGGIWVNDEDFSVSFDGSDWVTSGGSVLSAPYSDSTALVKGSSDSTKKVRIEVDGLTTGTTRVWTAQDADGTVAFTSDLASYQPLDADLTALAGLTSATDKVPYFTGIGTAGLLTRDTDGTLTANSDTVLATQKAVKTYVDSAITGGASDVMIFKGVIDCSANPNYPAADAGNLYKVSVAGKIGGGSGPNVEVGDTIYCITDSTSSGTHAGVGANWVISQVNIDGAVIGPASATNGNVALMDGTTGKIIKDSGLTLAGTNTGDETATTIGVTAHAATAKSAMVDADEIGLLDSAASFILKRATFINLKAFLKTYFDTLYATVSQPFDVHAFYPGIPTASAKVVRVPIARAVTFSANFSGSYFAASANATGTTVFDVQKNGSSIGSISIAAAGTTATFTTASGTSKSFVAGDYLSIIAPASADATLADPGFVLVGTR